MASHTPYPVGRRIASLIPPARIVPSLAFACAFVTHAALLGGCRFPEAVRQQAWGLFRGLSGASRGQFCGLLEACWGFLWASSGPLGASWGHLGGLLGASWGLLGASWAVLGRFCAVWPLRGPSWGPLAAALGPSWGPLGPSWGPPGPSWGPLWAILGPSWAVLGPSWGPLGPSWRLLGPSWAPESRKRQNAKNVTKPKENQCVWALEVLLRAPLGVSWAFLGQFWRLLGPSWAPESRKRRER